MMDLGNEELIYWSNIRDGKGNDSLTFAVETRTGEPVLIKIRDRVTLKLLATYIIPPIASQGIGQGLMLASSMKMSEMQQQQPDGNQGG